MIQSIADYPIQLLSQLIKAWEIKNKTIRTLIVLGIILIISAVLVNVFGHEFYPKDSNPNEIVNLLTIAIFSTGFLFLLIPVAYMDNKEFKKRQAELILKATKVSENPDKPQLAWDLARTKLENYLDRNLSQVRSIFFLSLFIMTIGFSLIIYGSIRIFDSPENFKPAIVVAISGLVLNFIGSTFLFLYKSVMSQAREYVIVLERINAVGMSVQVIDTIQNENNKLKDETKADLAKKLIELYTTGN